MTNDHSQLKLSENKINFLNMIWGIYENNTANMVLND